MEFRLSDRHIIALNMLLITVLAYFAALSLNDVVILGRAPAEAPIRGVHGRMVDDTSGKRPRAAYQAIVERDIFNLEPPPAPPPEVVAEDLRLTLIGVSQATKGKPYEIIADARGTQSVYRVGEEIPGSGKLIDVGKDRATVEHDGRQVVLELPKDEMNHPGGFANEVPTQITPLEASRGDELRHRRMRQRHFE